MAARDTRISAGYMHRKISVTVLFAVALLSATEATSLVAPATAGPLEDGLAAAQRGDYATALRLWRPFAEQGVAAAEYDLGSCT